jgi:hypothetical protein
VITWKVEQYQLAANAIVQTASFIGGRLETGLHFVMEKPESFFLQRIHNTNSIMGMML